jgi:hypothetical protein
MRSSKIIIITNNEKLVGGESFGYLTALFQLTEIICIRMIRMIRCHTLYYYGDSPIQLKAMQYHHEIHAENEKEHEYT